jgi:hypothetical protein
MELWLVGSIIEEFHTLSEPHYNLDLSRLVRVSAMRHTPSAMGLEMVTGEAL